MGKKLASSVLAALTVGGMVVLSAVPAKAVGSAGAPAGGWSEHTGVFSDQGSTAGVATRATPHHTGKAETKGSSGTKRAHGWTTWAGTRHYTTAQLEHYWPNSGVIATSGRKYGTGGTEAVSPWKAYNPNATSNGNGQARTYYGR